jgi:hypothetical protein
MSDKYSRKVSHEIMGNRRTESIAIPEMGARCRAKSPYTKEEELESPNSAGQSIKGNKGQK